MDKILFSKLLDSLQSKKEAITRCSSKKPGKYVVNTLLNAIKDVIQTLEQLAIPEVLETERSKTVAIIKDAHAQINQEFLASPLNHSTIETVTLGMKEQADRIRNELRNFDSQGLTWINR